MKLINNGKETKNVDPRNKLNDLTGEEWIYHTKTVWKTSYPSEYGHELRKKHGANKPPKLMQELLELFTKHGQMVLDPFAGVGGTLIAATLSGRKCVGIDINDEWMRIYLKVCEQEGLEAQEYIVGDSLKKLMSYDDDYFDYIVTDPPYNLNFQRTMCDGTYHNNNRKTDFNGFSDHKKDLSNLKTYGEFLAAMKTVSKQCFRILKPGKYFSTIIRNAYQNGTYLMTSQDICRMAVDCGFIMKGEIVWYQTGSRLRPYGYPYAYVPNLMHQYISVLYKPKK